MPLFLTKSNNIPENKKGPDGPFLLIGIKIDG